LSAAKLVCPSKLNAAQDQIAKLKEEIEALKAKYEPKK
jgi:uncharacterized small protein (DUF1192 family)